MGSDNNGPAVVQGNCWLSPVLAPLDSIVDDPVFTNSRGSLIPDQAVYDDWWSTTDDRRRRIAVGSRRFETVKAQLNAPPRWGHFLDPDDGSLLSVQRLERETRDERAERLRKVQAVLTRNRGQIEDVAVYGFDPSR